MAVSVGSVSFGKADFRDLESISRVQAGNYMFEFNNRKTKKRCEICSKFTIKTVDIFVSLLLTLHIFYTFLVFLLLSLSRQIFFRVAMKLFCFL